MKKILIITPRSPFSGRGADEQDRLSGIVWWINQGYEVKVITKVLPVDLTFIEKAREIYGIEIIPIHYKQIGKKSFFTLLKRVLNPSYWDGAAYEYFDPEIQREVQTQLVQFEPDLVWFDYTYLWPLYDLVKEKDLPIITRSINFEPEHFLDEDGHTILNRIRAIPKYWSEKRAIHSSDVFFSITPKEEVIYKKLSHTYVATLPLRALPTKLIPNTHEQENKIRIGFMPSTYTVSHNKEALRFIVEDIIPSLPSAIRNRIEVHVTGNKFPEDIRSILPPEVAYDGFVPSSIEFWQSMDIALSPSLFGAGMQQKIFEPIALGVPTITSKRGLGGYPFECGTHLLCAETKEQTIQALSDLVENAVKRKALSVEAQSLARQLFSQERLDSIIINALERI